MKPVNENFRRPRRAFFKKAAVLCAAALFGSGAARRSRAAVPDLTENPQQKSRYRLTEHIRRYYQRASL